MKKIRAYIFVILIALFGVGTVFFFPAKEIKALYVNYGGGIRGLLLTAMDHATLEKELGDNVFLHDRWIDLCGGMQRVTGVDVFPDDPNPVYRLRQGYESFLVEHADPLTEEETAGIASLKRSADNVSARSLFITIPRKACSLQSEFSARGVSDHAEELDALRKSAFADAGFDTLDLHEILHAQGKDHLSMYFRTDHHWTVHAGLWAAKEIAQTLGLDTSLLDPSLYTVQEHPGMYLGSEGKHCGRLYCAPDDLDVLIPSFDTELTLQIGQTPQRSGTFEQTMLFPEHFKSAPYKMFFPYGVFLDGDHGLVVIQNARATNEMHLLIIKDSFTNSAAPFLALCCAQVDLIDPRHYDGSVPDYIRQTQPDVVCVSVSTGCDNAVFNFQ